MADDEKNGAESLVRTRLAEMVRTECHEKLSHCPLDAEAADFRMDYHVQLTFTIAEVVEIIKSLDGQRKDSSCLNLSCDGQVIAVNVNGTGRCDRCSETYSITQLAEGWTS